MTVPEPAPISADVSTPTVSAPQPSSVIETTVVFRIPMITETVTVKIIRK